MGFVHPWPLLVCFLFLLFFGWQIYPHVIGWDTWSAHSEFWDGVDGVQQWQHGALCCFRGVSMDAWLLQGGLTRGAYTHTGVFTCVWTAHGASLGLPGWCTRIMGERFWDLSHLGGTGKGRGQ